MLDAEKHLAVARHDLLVHGVGELGRGEIHRPGEREGLEGLPLPFEAGREPELDLEGDRAHADPLLRGERADRVRPDDRLDRVVRGEEHVLGVHDLDDLDRPEARVVRAGDLAPRDRREPVVERLHGELVLLAAGIPLEDLEAVDVAHLDVLDRVEELDLERQGLVVGHGSPWEGEILTRVNGAGDVQSRTRGEATSLVARSETPIPP